MTISQETTLATTYARSQKQKHPVLKYMNLFLTNNFGK